MVAGLHIMSFNVMTPPTTVFFIDPMSVSISSLNSGSLTYTEVPYSYRKGATTLFEKIDVFSFLKISFSLKMDLKIIVY